MTDQVLKRGRGRPSGATTEVSVMPVFRGVPVALSCLDCGEDMGEFSLSDLPRGRVRCTHCFGGNVFVTHAAPRTSLGHSGHAGN